VLHFAARWPVAVQSDWSWSVRWGIRRLGRPADAIHLVQAFTRLCRRDAARGTSKQPKAKSRLEPTDGLAQRRLGNAELRSRSRKVAFARNREVGKEIIDVFALHL
jgi:hypothetical protein